MNKREISDSFKGRITSLKSNLPQQISFNINDLSYMKDGNFLDLDKAKNASDWSLAERITKDPRRQTIDEKIQIEKLKSIFPDILKLNEGEMGVCNQMFLKKENINSDQISHFHEIDAISKINSYIFYSVLKGGQKVGGGAQDKQFEQAYNSIINCPLKTSKEKNILIIYVSGSFWVDKTKRKKYRGYEKIINEDRNFSKIEILNIISKNKKCIILSDENLPLSQEQFYNEHIKGIYE